MIRNRQKTLRVILILLSVLASLKMLFFAVGMDEEYQVVMSYRNAIGDRLFLDMWEPHQSSAFLCTLLMKPYLMLFGTTGIVIYLRVWGTLIHLGISFYLYKVLRHFVTGNPAVSENYAVSANHAVSENNAMSENHAWLLALLYYNIIPKQIILPEFGIMQVWFYTLLALFLMEYSIKSKIHYLALAAIALALNVLSYPSCLILFPFALFWLARFSGAHRWRDMGIFTAVCVICAAAYLGMLFCYTHPAQLLETLSHILNGDVTHSLTLTDKLALFVQKALYMAALWLGCRILVMAAVRRKHMDPGMTDLLAILPACAIQLLCWILLDTGYEYLNLHLEAAAAAGLAAYRRRSRIGQDNGPDMAGLLYYGILGAFLSLLGVVYLTDITLTESIPHAMPAAIFGVALTSLENQNARTPKAAKWLNLTLLVLLSTAILGKAYTLRGGDYSNILQSGGIMKKGPAAGTISNYIRAYIYNKDYEDWQMYMEDGDKVLIVVNLVQNLDTVQYLFKDVEISHYSIVNPTAYDQRLLDYWTLYPEKAPNVIIVDCWYGDLKEDPDSWIMNYIENDFGYSQVNDGNYIRIYRK